MRAGEVGLLLRRGNWATDREPKIAPTQEILNWFSRLLRDAEGRRHHIPPPRPRTGTGRWLWAPVRGEGGLLVLPGATQDGGHLMGQLHRCDFSRERHTGNFCSFHDSFYSVPIIYF